MARSSVLALGVVLALLSVVLPAARARQESDTDKAEAVQQVRAARELADAGKRREAVAAYQTALARVEAAFGEDDPSTVVVLNELAYLYQAMGRYEEAEPLYRRCLRLREAKAGTDHLDVTPALNNLAALYWAMGEYAQAEPLYQRCLRIREQHLVKNHADVAETLNNLGVLYQDMGHYVRAEALLQRSLSIWEDRLGSDHPDVASALNNLAELYRAMAQFARAEPLYQRCLRIREEKLGEDHRLVGLTLNNLGELYRAMGRFARAEPLYQRSLRIKEIQLGKDHPGVAISLNNLGLLYQDMEQYARAEPLLRRGLQIWEDRLGVDHPNVATALNNLAKLYHLMGQDAKAGPLYQRSLRISEAKLGQDHPNLTHTLNNLAALLAKQEQTKEASDLFHRARQGSRRHISRVLPTLPPREQAAFLGVSERRDLAGALSLGRVLAVDAEQRSRSAEWLVNSKAAGQEALAQATLLSRDRQDPATRALAESLRQVRAQLARLALARLPAGKEKEHRDRVAELDRRERDLARRLAAAGGSAAIAADWVLLDHVRQAVPAGAVFIDVARFDAFDFEGGRGKGWQPARYVVWVTPRTGPVRLIDLGEAAKIDALVDRVRQVLGQADQLAQQKGEPEADQVLREPLRDLSRLVLHPLLPHVGTSTQWVVSPDGQLSLVPWQMLLLPDGRFAVEKHQVHHVVSGRALLATPARGVRARAPLILADPDFDLRQDEPAATGSPQLGGMPQGLRLGRVQRLKSTGTEALAATASLRAFTGEAPLVFTRARAVKRALGTNPNPRVLLLATHGFFLPDRSAAPGKRPSGLFGDDRSVAGWENPLVRCGLLLAGCNQAAENKGDNGVLTGLEVVGLDLRGTELVVLSACQTGVGDVQSGEGVAGLRQAFQLAGAEAVLASLWDVPDKSSALLMSRFFAQLGKGKGKAEALRQAQLELIAERREDFAVAHPLFWAAFTLTASGADGPPAVPRSSAPEAKEPVTPPPVPREATAEERQPATLVVRLPADATLTIDADPTEQRGEVRTLRTPPLRPGRSYSYTFVATWDDNGRTQRRERLVRFRAGERVEVDLRPAAVPPETPLVP